MKYEGIKVAFRCDHPEIENNVCPIGSVDCADCRHCVASMAAEDLFKLARKEDSK